MSERIAGTIRPMQYEHIAVPPEGRRITVNPDNTLNVPDNPIIPYVEGDGIGVDVTPAMLRVVNAAVEKAYGRKRRISWMEVYSGEKANARYGQWFPDETLHALGLRGLDQRPSRHTGRRRHPLAERGDAAEPRSLRLRTADPVFPGRREPDAGRQPHGHGDLPREHGGHLR